MKNKVKKPKENLFYNFGITFEHPYWIVIKTIFSNKNIYTTHYHREEVIRTKDRSEAVAVVKNKKSKQKAARARVLEEINYQRTQRSK